jgi:hypothetical protein
LEVQVTPENRTRQLRWPTDGLEQVRQGTAPWRHFLIPEGEGVQTSAVIGPGFWVTQAKVPAQCLGLQGLNAATVLEAAVCRYDEGPNGMPVVSSTAILTEPSFHRRDEWTRLVLSTATP